MNKRALQKTILHVLTVFGVAVLAGCTAPVSAELPETIPTITSGLTVTPTGSPTPTATPVPTATCTPTVTLTPTVTPTPSPSPTPTEVPVYNQILLYEAENASDPDIPVKAALLINITEGKVIYSNHALEVIYPASITKLMTALVAFSSEIDLTETVEISKIAVTPVISSAKMCGFKAGDRIRMKDLLGCMLIYSGNDTSVAVAEHLYGSEAEFVVQMNKKAEELGLLSSFFCNSHGLPDDNHVTSAYDIYLIMQKLFIFEEFLGIIESGSIEVDVLREESLKTFSFTSTNQFLWGSYQLPDGITMIGGKTGTTNKAGCCLTLYVQDKNGSCYIAEIFGAESYESLYPCMTQLLTHISDE